MDVGRLVPAVQEGEAGSDVSGWKLREHREREEWLPAETAAVGAEDELGLPTPSFMALADEE